MKKLFLVLAVSLMCFTAKAQQFTNPSFETWAANMPQGWSTLGFMGFNLCTMEQSTDANTGNSHRQPKLLIKNTACATHKRDGNENHHKDERSRKESTRQTIHSINRSRI